MIAMENTETICESTERERWLTERGKGIGSSDAAAVLGLSPWRTPLAVYAEKLGLVEPDPQSEAAYWGTRIEPLVLERFRAETGRDVKPGGRLIRSVERPWQLCTLDGTQVSTGRSDPGVVEIKCTALRGRWDDGVPDYVETQVQHQLAVTGFQWASVAVLFGGSEFFWIDVERDEKFIATLTAAEAAFWQAIIDREPPPAEATDADRAILAKLWPKDSGELVTLDGSFMDLDDRREELKAQARGIDKELLGIENILRQAIGEASFAILPNGTCYQYKVEPRSEHIVKASSPRVLRRKGTK